MTDIYELDPIQIVVNVFIFLHHTLLFTGNRVRPPAETLAFNQKKRQIYEWKDIAEDNIAGLVRPLANILALTSTEVQTKS